MKVAYVMKRYMEEVAMISVGKLPLSEPNIALGALGHFTGS